MDILQTAIQAEGSVNALARALGVAQNVVSNWRARGLPKPWRLVLELKYAQAPTKSANDAIETAADQAV